MLDDRPPLSIEWPPYLYATGPTFTSKTPTANFGKWLIFVPKSDLEAIWLLVGNATHDGLLGPASKVSTAFDSPLADDSDTGLICVYAIDSNDSEDLARILVSLRNLGISQRLTFKSDKATTERRYGPGSVDFVSQAGAVTFSPAAALDTP